MNEEIRELSELLGLSVSDIHEIQNGTLENLSDYLTIGDLMAARELDDEDARVADILELININLSTIQSELETIKTTMSSDSLMWERQSRFIMDQTTDPKLQEILNVELDQFKEIWKEISATVCLFDKGSLVVDAVATIKEFRETACGRAGGFISAVKNEFLKRKQGDLKSINSKMGDAA